MKPLTTVLKKEAQEKFQWTTEAEQFFEVLKLAIVSSAILIMPDFNLPFVVECNASTSGVGAVLIQQNRPVAYFSKVISDKSTAMSAYEMELIALVLAIQH